mmetsp:Transcript_100951/g.175270  ORF Transcript_100951/g.175270 Transcript_100951/m.175270 type:complete len:406 (+) Transcript_100951:148-1365(+)
MAKEECDAETTPLLKKNFACEKLDLCEDSLVKYQKAGVLDNPNNKIMGYNMAKLNGVHALWYMKDSIFFNARLWWTALAYTIICGCCAGLVLANRRAGYRFGRLSAAENIKTLEQISNYFAFVSAIMLGMYVSLSVSRWWEMRQCLNGLWNAINDIMLLLSTRFPSKKDRPMKEKVLRLSLLSHRLLYAKARKLEGPETFQGILDCGLITPDEVEALKDETAKAQVVWVWISTILVQLKKSRRIDNIVLGTLEGLCSKATNSILTSFSYIHTQIPFNYVHLLVTNVILANFLLVAKCGFVIGGEEMHRRPNKFLFMAQLVECIIVPLMYHAILGLACELENPFGCDEVDFPCLSYHVIIRNECETFIRMGESPPDTLLDVMEEGKLVAAQDTDKKDEEEEDDEDE